MAKRLFTILLVLSTMFNIAFAEESNEGVQSDAQVEPQEIVVEEAIGQQDAPNVQVVETVQTVEAVGSEQEIEQKELESK